eukprot:jgi/Tetstr1/435738/TSEL_024636.t1
MHLQPDSVALSDGSPPSWPHLCQSSKLSVHWIAVQQAQEDGPAVMRLAPRPVVPQDDQCAGVIEAITSQKPVPVEEGRSFSGCEMQHGQWRNYLVGVIGELSLDDDEMMWPNQVFHGHRTQRNLRDMADLARFLSDIRQEDVAVHLSNLEQMATERRYDWRWCWDLLRARWGAEALGQFGITETSGFGAVVGPRPSLPLHQARQA